MVLIPKSFKKVLLKISKQPLFVCLLFARQHHLFFYFLSVVQRFFRGKRKDVGSGLRTLDQAIEQILVNIEWKKTHQTTIKEWIDNKLGKENGDVTLKTNQIII